MIFFFAWVHNDDVFDPKIHAREDVKILSLTLSHQEGEAALLRLEVMDDKPLKGKHCFVSCSMESSQNKENRDDDIQLLFKGSLCHFPLKVSEKIWRLEFRSFVDHTLFQKTQSALAAEINPHFLSNVEDITPGDYLESSSSLFQFDRVTGQCVLSNLFKGREIYTPKNVFEKKTKVTFTELPLHGIEVVLKARWTQDAKGEVDIAPALSKAFSLGMINTFTPKSFAKNFPKTGRKLGERRGRSGCRIVESALVPFIPFSTGGLDVYPLESPEFWHRGQEDSDFKKISFPRTYFQAQLVVEWKYRQERCEVIQFSVKNQLPSPAYRPAKTLTFSLKNLSELEGSFFKTEKGKNAIFQAYKRARAYLAASARCIEVTFEIPFWEGLELHLDLSINLKEILGLKRDVFGKVISYQLQKTGLVGFARVCCALSFGMEERGENKASYGEDLSTDYMENIPSWQDEISQKLKPRGILHTHPLNTLAIVDHVNVIYAPEEQVNLFHRIENIKEGMKTCGTRFEVILQDLRTYPMLEEKVRLSDFFYAPPPLISLDELKEIV